MLGAVTFTLDFLLVVSVGALGRFVFSGYYSSFFNSDETFTVVSWVFFLFVSFVRCFLLPLSQEKAPALPSAMVCFSVEFPDVLLALSARLLSMTDFSVPPLSVFLVDFFLGFVDSTCSLSLSCPPNH